MEMKLEDLAGLVPSLTVVKWSDPKKNVRFDHVDMKITGEGYPIAGQDERVVSRWIGRGMLVATMAPDGKGPRSGGGGSYKPCEVAEGEIAFAITQSRLLGTVRDGTSIWGKLQWAARKVVAFAWPYEDMSTVEVEERKKAFGGTRTSSVEVSWFNQPAMLMLPSAFPLSENWRQRSTIAKADLATFASDLIRSATSHLATDAPSDRERERLRRVGRGERNRDGVAQVAWLVDPESN